MARPLLAALALFVAATGAGSAARAASAGSVWTWEPRADPLTSSIEISALQVPTRLAGVLDAIAVAGSPTHRLALQSDGTVWAWGNNLSGQLGDGTTVSSPVPVRVRGLSGVVAIAAPSEGWYLPSRTRAIRQNQRPARPVAANGVGGYSLALKADGTVWAWGADGPTGYATSPQQIRGLQGITAIAAGTNDALALARDGTVWRWGADTGLIFGTPVRVAGLTDITAIAADWNEYLAVRRDGTVWQWPRDRTPVRIAGVANIRLAVLAHPGPLALGLTKDGTVWEWAYVNCPTCRPHRVPHLSHITAIASGTGHSLALRADGTVWQWHWSSSESRPRRVAQLTGVTAIAAAGSSNLAVTAGSTQPVFPCPAGPPPNVVQVSRSNLLGNDLSRFPSFRLVEHARNRVRALFSATCHLQPVTGVYYCPADLGIVYRLVFRLQGRAILRVVVNASGCTWLYTGNRLGAGQAYWVWFGPPLRNLSWAPAARRWARSLSRLLGMRMSTLSPLGG